jgi:hypothetical protein
LRLLQLLPRLPFTFVDAMCRHKIRAARDCGFMIHEVLEALLDLWGSVYPTHRLAPLPPRAPARKKNCFSYHKAARVPLDGSVNRLGLRALNKSCSVSDFHRDSSRLPADARRFCRQIPPKADSTFLLSTWSSESWLGNCDTLKRFHKTWATDRQRVI